MIGNIPSHFRSQIRWASGLKLLVAVWLFVSAFTVVANPTIAANNMFVGIVVSVLAALQLGGLYARSWPSWCSIFLGLWTAVAPWVFDHGQDPSNVMAVNNGCTGAAMLLLGMWSAVLTADAAVAAGAHSGGTRPSFGS